MEDGGGNRGFLDWDWDSVAENELRAIEAAYSSASSATKRRSSDLDLDVENPDAPVPRPRGRRLPRWAQSDATPSNIRGPGRSSTARTDDRHSASCPTNAAWSIAPLRRPGNFKVKYPTMVFRGSIIYCKTALEVERASMELLDKIRSMKQNMNHVSLGFDIEWKPIFKRGHAQRKAAVMQICLDKATCYVMHIIHSGIPPVLKSLLEDDISIKVGVCIAGDACKIIKDYNVSVEPLDDLSSLANLKLGGAPKKWSLASLTETITCKQLAKPNRIRLGNWEADVLSKEQLQYAATDAFVSWYLYEALKGYPDAIIEAKDMDKAENVMNEHQKQTQSLR